MGEGYGAQGEPSVGRGAEARGQVEVNINSSFD